MSFLFAVLFSNLFWIGYAIVSLFMGTVTMRLLFPKITYCILNDCSHHGYSYVCGAEKVFAPLAAYIFWLPILTVLALFHVSALVFQGFGIGFKGLFVYMNKIIPEFKIVKEG